MRTGTLNFGPWARAIGVVAALAAAVAAAKYVRRAETPSAGYIDAEFAAPGDPLAPELARCRTLGMAALQDAACEAAWTENRRRFFAPNPPSSALDTTRPGTPAAPAAAIGR